MESEYKKLPVIPCDDEGYVISFDSNDSVGIKAFFEEYGVVVIKNAISNSNADAAYSEIWDYIEDDSVKFRNYYVERERSKESFLTRIFTFSSNCPPSVDRNDINTWIKYWPFVSGGKGIIGDGVVKGKAAWENRQSEGIFKAFSTVLGTEDLLVSCDRYGFMRPTMQIPFNTGIEDKNEWRTSENWVHWDLNPWYWTNTNPTPQIPEEYKKKLEDLWKYGKDGLLISENNDTVDFKGFKKLQGLVALVDSKKDDGGFCCVPGFQHIIKKWSEHNEIYNNGHFVSVQKSDKLIEKLQNIPMRKGSLVIWSSCLPHCNYPNRSANPRACQYIKMFPKQVVPDNIMSHRKNFIKSLLPNDFKPNKIGKIVLDI